MTQFAHLVLEDGSFYRGRAFGDTSQQTHGEVVFNTAMTGYQEILTDPSYAGQIVVLTYPLIGNYGINRDDFESRKIQVSGFVVRDHCDAPSHSASDMTLDEFLKSQGIVGISGVDTRAITRRLRTSGVMMGTIAFDETPEKALARLKELPTYEGADFVREVSTSAPYSWDTTMPGVSPVETKYRVLVSDCGLKYNILRNLRARGCEVMAYPATASADELLAMKPDGVLMSPGPGDPDLLDYAVETAKGLSGRVPMMGICLGNQIIARAFGGPELQAEVRAQRRQPSSQGDSNRPRPHHRTESRLRCRCGQPSVGDRGQPHQPERRHRRGTQAQVAADYEHPVPLRGVARPTRQRVPVRQVYRDDPRTFRLKR